MTDPCIILTSCGSGGKAEEIAEALVDQALASSVTVIARTRTYYAYRHQARWGEAFQLLIYATQSQFPACERVIKRLHTYHLPEVSMLRIEQGSEEFLAWIRTMGHRVPPT